MNNNKVFQGGLILCLLFIAQWSTASTFLTNSIATSNRSPFIQLFEIASPDFHPMGMAGENVARLQLELANYLSFGNDPSGEELFIDGETWISTLSLEHQIRANLSIGFQTSLRGHGEGIADRFIFQFHDVLGLPQNGRTDDFHDRLLWRLYDRDDLKFELDSATGGIGDTLIHLAWQSPEGAQWRFHVGLPTGNFEQQTGSEGVDLGLAWANQNPDWLQHRQWLRESALSIWYGLGVAWLDHSPKTGNINTNPWVASVRGGFAWRALQSWQLKVQLDSHTPLFDTNIRELGWLPVQISLASTHNIGKKTTLEWGLTEDLRPRVTPDVVFNLLLSQRF